MNLLSLADWPARKIEGVVDRALRVKEAPGRHVHDLSGRVLLMIFQKPSLRTRISFEVAALQLGGHAIPYDLGTSPWGAGKETPADTARTVSRYVDAVVARLFRHEDLRMLAEHASVPVINGLTDVEHPCQALGDLMTLLEKKGRLRGLKLAYVGDGLNNVTHSLMDACAKAGLDLAIACPGDPAYAPAPEVVDRARAFAAESGGRLDITTDAREAVRDADAVYTDTWMSYHIPPGSRPERHRALAPYRVTSELMARARPDALFMHCLPAERGAEQDADVIDGPRSVVFDQAENRLHSAKAILLELIV